MPQNTISDYWSLTKGGLVAGNLITVIAGFVLGSEGVGIVPGRFAAVVGGMALVMASGCVFNNVIDRDIDGRMVRTKDRVLVEGAVSSRAAVAFGTALGAGGFFLLSAWTSLAAVLCALAGFFFYVGAYSMWAKRRGAYGVLVGAIAGAVPPIAGYAAASGRVDAIAGALFAIIFFWQMPHFFAIAIRRGDDYAAAGVPVMPVAHGVRRTKIAMALFAAAFAAAAALPALFGREGKGYLFTALALGLGWFAYALIGFRQETPAAAAAWARRMYLVSLAVMVLLFSALTFGAALRAR